MRSYKVPIIVAAVALLAAVAGLAAAKFAGGADKPAAKELPLPAPLDTVFTINLADKDSLHYVKLGVAVQLDAMTEEELHVYEAGGLEAGGHGSSGPTGAELVGKFAPLKDAVIGTTSRFTSAELQSAAGKERLKTELVKAMNAAQADFHRPKGEDGEVPNMAAPPYHIQDVYFNEFAVQ